MKFKRIRATLTNPELKSKLFFTLLILLVFRLGINISVPGIDIATLRTANSTNNGIFEMMNLLGGGGLENYSIFALSVGPYITASIVTQLLAMDIIPYFTELQNGGDVGRKKLGQITRYLAIILAFFQAYMTTAYFNTQNAAVDNAGVLAFSRIALYMTTGTLFVLWLADRITAKGIGNGTSMIIFAGIVDRVPVSFYDMIRGFFNDSEKSIYLASALAVLIVIIFIALVTFTVKTQQATRKIPVQYASNRSSRGKEASYLPFKINVAGVIPVIFASTILMVPATLIQFFVTTPNDVTTFLSRLFNYTDPYGMVLYLILIFSFTYFYANLQVDSRKLSENLSRSGGYIIGIRPGEETERFINKTINRLNFLGATSLAIIAFIPLILPHIPFLGIDGNQASGLGGTGLIIVVGVALEVVNKIDSLTKTRSQRSFIR